MVGKKGNLIQLALQGEFQVIVHGCNCYGRMGKGIALGIKNQWPDAYKADLDFPVPFGPDRLGKISVSSPQSNGLIIINAYTQVRHWHERGEDYNAPLVDYNAVGRCFAAVRELVSPETRIGFPLIGCGLAKGRWDMVYPQIAQQMVGYDATYVYL